jgi:hypothetical protein
MTKLTKVAYKTILLSSVIMLENNRKKSKRTKWTKDWLLKRETLSHVNLLKELKVEKNDWFNYLRMDENCYLKVLQHITPLIKRQDTVMRKSISPHERLTMTLRFLATGRSYEDMKLIFRKPRFSDFGHCSSCSLPYKQLAMFCTSLSIQS